jgi:hypothetical protein
MKQSVDEELAFIFEAHCRAGTAISPHLPRLRELASKFAGQHAVEFGVKRGASSSALLLGLGPAGKLISFDTVPTREAKALKVIAGDRWDYRIEDSRTANVPTAGLVFFDSLHTYAQVAVELKHVSCLHARMLIFHDVTTFGEIGADGETGRHSWTYVPGAGSVPFAHQGIRPAIDEFMIANPSWRIADRRVEAHGLLVLAQ